MKSIAIILIIIACLTPVTGFTGNSSKNFGGVGIDGMPWADGRIVVKQLVAGGPAQVAGIKVGDIITHIDGKATEGSDFRQMVDYRLRGQAGTKVMLKIRRAGSAKTYTYTLTRRQLVLTGPRKADKNAP